MNKLLKVVEPEGYESLQRFGEYASECPYCHKEIFIPEYRVNPITLEEMRKRTQEKIKRYK
jgi:hypothetical protein